MPTFRTPQERFEHYRDCFSSPVGQKVLADLRAICYQDVSTHIPGDSHETAFREGMRNVLLVVLMGMSPPQPDNSQESP